MLDPEPVGSFGTDFTAVVVDCHPMRGQWYRASWVIAAAVFVAGCAAEASLTPTGSVFFPRHAGLLGNGYEARLAGPLVFADGCVWIQPPDGDRFLILWPSNTILGKINDLPAVLGPDHELLVETGSVAVLGGRSTDLETAVQLVGPIPKRCAGEAFWEAGAVESGH